MKNSKNSIIIKLQSIFMIIALLGVLAITLAESRMIVSMLLITAIIILAFVNMLWLRQLSVNINRDEVQKI